MLILYGEDDKVILAHEKRGVILIYPIKGIDLVNQVFVFSDGTTVQFDFDSDIPEITVVRKCESFVAMKRDVEEYSSDVLYMGMNIKWVVQGSIFFKDAKWA